MMDTSDMIDISSSDSDIEIDDTANLRKLPSTLSGSVTNSNTSGHNGHSRKLPFSNNNTYASKERFSHGNGQNFPKHSDVGTSTQNSLRANNSKYVTDGSAYPNRMVNSRISNYSGTEFEKMSSQLALNRTLPSSSVPSTSNSDFNRSNGRIWDTPGGSHSHHSPGTSSTFHKTHPRDSYDEDMIMYDKRGARVLPPSLVHAKTAPAPYATAGDSAFRSGVAEEKANEADERLIYEAALQDLNQPKSEVNLPDGLLSVSLLRHQKIALAWMLQKENRSCHCAGGILADDQGLGKTISMIALILMQKHLQSQLKPEDSADRKPVALNIDDDDDDDGVKGSVDMKNEETADVKPIPEVSTSARVFSKRRPDAGTLVVCPASVVRQWARELDEKITEEKKLKVLIYHGGNRTKDPSELASFDVVVTTFSIVTNELPKQSLVDDDEDERNGERYGLAPELSNKRKKKAPAVSQKGKKSKKGMDNSGFDSNSGPLAKVAWLRVILDEAQTIKNHRTQVARACCSLRAKRRWCLSGTPIQNSIDDLYSYFRFLKYDPYAVYKSFYNTIKVPISRNAVQGYKKLQAVLRAIMLRRTKGTLIEGKPIINLPPKTVAMSKVPFSLEERAFYAQLEADSRSQFKAYAAAGTVSQNYANILLMLLRLRQACDHPYLVKEYDSDFVGKESIEMAQILPQDMLRNLLSIVQSLDFCRRCNDTPEDPVVTMCGHIFCYECVSEYLTGDDNVCPALDCKQQVGSDIIFSMATLRRSINDDLGGSSTNLHYVDKGLVMQTDYTSSKIKALLEILLSNCKPESCNEDSYSQKEIVSDGSGVSVTKHTTTFANPPSEEPIKTIVFSQWTGMLDLVQTALQHSGLEFRRLDGKMSLASRDRAVKDFNTDPEVTVMIMSLKAGNLGLNMVAACHVVLLDLWWNPTTEDQAVDRAHRIGQTRPVTVTRLTIKDTVEDRILDLQEEKRKMVASAFGEDHGGSSGTRLTVDDLKYLFMV